MSTKTNLRYFSEFKNLPVDSVSLNDWNPNLVSDSMMDAIKDDIEKHGFIGTIVVQKSNKERNSENVIINGEHRFKALIELGATEVPSIVLDVDDKTARLLTLRLNREHGDLMPDKVVALLESLDRDLNIQTLSELTAMTQQELELVTALDISEIPSTEYRTEMIPDLPRDDGMQTEGRPEKIEQVFAEDRTATVPTTNAMSLSWNNIEALVRMLANKIRSGKKTYGVILALGRGGVIPARLIQRELGVKELRMIPVDKQKLVDLRAMGSYTMRESDEGGLLDFLCVDDIFDSGRTIQNMKQFAREYERCNVDYAVLLGKEPVTEDVMCGFKIAQDSLNFKKWVIFPWEKGIEA